MKQTVRCTQFFCKCGTPARACRHSVVEPARQITQGHDHGAPASGLPLKGGAEITTTINLREARIADIGKVLDADLQAASRELEPAPQGEAYGVPISGLPLKDGAELPDFAIPLADKAQAMIAAFDLLSDEAWASLPEPVWTQIQSAADHLQLAIFNYKTKGAQA